MKSETTNGEHMDRYLDANPPYLYEDYPSTTYRSPTQVVKLPPEYLARTPGPSWAGIIQVTDLDSDLTKQRDGQPIGQRIVLGGLVLDREGEPVPGCLIEIWQANGRAAISTPSIQATFQSTPTSPVPVGLSATGTAAISSSRCARLLIPVLRTRALPPVAHSRVGRWAGI